MMTTFGGEEYLNGEVPNYDTEQRNLIAMISVSSFVWIVLMPHLLARKPKTISKSAVIVRRRVVNGKTVSVTEKKRNEENNTEPKQLAVFKSTLGCIVSTLFILLRFSPHNYYIPRRVFQTPLLTPDECQVILDMADRAAEQAYQKALKADPVVIDEESSREDIFRNSSIKGLREPPYGWQKTRHQSYPTTDLNLVTDPFLKEDQDWIKSILDRRLAPTLSRLFGIPASSIRANDIFIVRYDADKRSYLSSHTDDGHISFNILLTDDFEGGGTRFFDRLNQHSFAHVQPTTPGQALTHSALIRHEGVHITKGTRIILVGFLSVDRIDPWTFEPTGMNLLNSWLSLPWVSVKLNEGYLLSQSRRRKTGRNSWKDSPYFRSFFAEMYQVLTNAGDIFAEHQVTQLVKEKDHTAYLRALDKAYDGRGRHSNWFRGQGVNIDIDGTIDSEWTTRKDNIDRYSEL